MRGLSPLRFTSCGKEVGGHAFLVVALPSAPELADEEDLSRRVGTAATVNAGAPRPPLPSSAFGMGRGVTLTHTPHRTRCMRHPRHNNRAEATRSPLPDGRQPQPLIGAALPFAHSASGS